MIKNLFVLTAAVWLLLGCSKEENVQQLILFSVSSIEYKNKDSNKLVDMRKECGYINDNVQEFLNNGWQVVSSSSKERVVAGDTGICKGTEYVLKKKL